MEDAAAKPTSGQMDRHDSCYRSMHRLRPLVHGFATRHQKGSQTRKKVSGFNSPSTSVSERMLIAEGQCLGDRLGPPK